MKGQFLGSFEVLESLGAGGMGEVYRARDTRLGRDVAIKVLPGAVASDPERLARLRREAQLLASLNHPHIASIYSVGDHEGAPFLVLELVEGETLEARLRRGPLPLGDALEIARQVCEALEAAHSGGVVHRDLKPSNVMISARDSRAKVLDFGIAKPLGMRGGAGATDLTGDGATLGTTPYLSPEQVTGSMVDGRTDVWSFGCVLYEMLAGHHPFARSSGPATIAAIMEADPDWDALPRRTPRDLVKVLQRCLRRDPDARYGGFAAVRSALDAARPAVRSGIRGSERRWLAAGAAALVVVIGAWVAGAFGGRSGTPPVVGAPIMSLAVIPFENLSGDPELGYIAVAMSEILATDLGALGTMRVTARESSSAFSGSTESAARIAEQLDVDALVRGSVVQVGNDVVITARLIDARDGAQVWTDRYEGTATELFGLMSGAAEAIASGVGATAGGAARGNASSRRADPRAEQLFWRGFTELENYTESSIATAIDALSEAIAIEPTYALAHAELARAYQLAIQFGYLGSEEGTSLVRASAERALALDASLAEASVALFGLDYRGSRDWDGVEEGLAALVARSPNSVGAWHLYSHVLGSKLKLEESRQAALRGREVDPLSRTMRLHMTEVYRNMRRWDDLIAIADSTLELYPDYNRILGSRVEALRQTGRMEEALTGAERLVAVSREPDNVNLLGIVYASLGREREATDIIAELIEAGGGPWRISRVYLALGDIDRAFDYLGQAVEQNVGPLADLVVLPQNDPLRADSVRWRALLRSAGFAEALVLADPRDAG